MTDTKKSIRAWFENFWYYYKWYTIVSLCLVASLIFVTAQCANKPKYDYNILLACCTSLINDPQQEALENELEKYAQDLNGDGEVNILLINCTYNQKFSDRSTVSAVKQKIQSQIINNSAALLVITDDECFEWLNSITDIEGGFFEDLNLPLNNGRAFDINTHGILNNAENNCSVEGVWPEQLNISRRIVKDTLIENNKNTQKYLQSSDALLNNIVNNTYTK